jgi:hypothetical protein
VKRMQGGIYLARTNKPYSIFGWPIVGRHNGYTGQSKAYRLRWQQHAQGGGKFKSVPKSWSDLDPEFYRILPLPAWMFERAPRIVNLLEGACIVLTAPVYNIQLNKWNPRRISKKRAEKQRRWREGNPPLLRSMISAIRSILKLLIGGVLLLLLRKYGVL